MTPTQAERLFEHLNVAQAWKKKTKKVGKLTQNRVLFDLAADV